MASSSRILIVDDNYQVRSALRNLVEQDADWKVCGEAGNGEQAIERTKETSPDVIVLDFQMPVMNGLQAAREIVKEFPDVQVLLCTAYLSSNLIEAARRAGIRGAVSKSVAHDVVRGIQALLRREDFFCQPS